MLNIVWLGMILTSVLTAVVQNRVNDVVLAVTASAKLGFELALGLASMMALWLGILNIAQQSGLVTKLARALQPLMRPLFPDVPLEDPAMGAMVLNFSANLLGLGNVATPFGLQAMKELQRLNGQSEVASNAMCTFLAINTSSIQLLPTTAIAYLALNGSEHPSTVILSALLASCVSTAVAIVAVKHLERWPIDRFSQWCSGLWLRWTER